MPKTNAATSKVLATAFIAAGAVNAPTTEHTTAKNTSVIDAGRLLKAFLSLSNETPPEVTYVPSAHLASPGILSPL